jgi:peptidoglycan hydrolase-like protein with peptidoglycan-binding domain
LSYSIAVPGRRLTAAAVIAAGALIGTPAIAAAQTFGSRTLSKGMRGSDVRTLQKDLTVTGIPTPVTGIFNVTTQTHVISFQRHYRLSPDGVVGPQTIHELRVVVTRIEKSKSSHAVASEAMPASGGTSDAPPPADAPVKKATLSSSGLAVAPSGAPQVIREVIAAANKIAFKPYVYGGGHASFNSYGYDCSGSVSYALHGAGLLSSPMDSTEFESWGASGAGRWITIYANGGHAYMNIAGLWFDTAAQSSSNGNDRWSAPRISPASGFIVRHPTGW